MGTASTNTSIPAPLPLAAMVLDATHTACYRSEANMQQESKVLACSSRKSLCPD